MSTRPYLAADDRRRALLDAADRLFERDGFGGLSMVAVAAEAGVSRALLYKHFPDQASLYVAMFEDRAERFIAGAASSGGGPTSEGPTPGFDPVLQLPLGELRVMRAVVTGDGGPDLAPLRERFSDHLWSRWSPVFNPPRDEAATRVVLLSLSSMAIDFAIAVQDGALSAEVAERVWLAATLSAVAGLPAATPATG